LGNSESGSKLPHSEIQPYSMHSSTAFLQMHRTFGYTGQFEEAPYAALK
jgi:hypothetical protein